MLTYKGYTGKFEFDDEADIFHGEVLDVRDVVTFQGKSVEELEQALRLGGGLARVLRRTRRRA